ncbi:MAG: GntR family transcriptional regulator [Bryobacterales bacterium]|nr:GntR family transcriptional regulator [Bryobacterales bacterium]MBV9396633.1 GntR family transcriptional regulator [Bryobacterales bacterium]
MPVRPKALDGDGTLADQAYRVLKQSILRGEYPEGSFLSEVEVAKRFRIGRTPFREACNRLRNEQLLDAVPRHGFLVPEMSFHEVRDLLETRLILEGVIAELAAKRADEAQLAQFQRLYRTALQHARAKAGMDEQVHANTEFHLHIARMAHNRELESLLRGVLERSTRLFYMIVRSSPTLERDTQDLLKPIVDAIRRKDPAAAHKAVIRDITHGQMNVLGRDLWEKPR